jgi:hypothetical protein
MMMFFCNCKQITSCERPTNYHLQRVAYSLRARLTTRPCRLYALAHVQRRRLARRYLRPTRRKHQQMWSRRYLCVVYCRRTWSRHLRRPIRLSRPSSAMTSSRACADSLAPCTAFRLLQPQWSVSSAMEASSCGHTGHA